LHIPSSYSCVGPLRKETKHEDWHVRHDLVHFMYMHYVLVLDRHKMCPVPMEEMLPFPF
jgi:hypothetical protein